MFDSILQRGVVEDVNWHAFAEQPSLYAVKFEQALTGLRRRTAEGSHLRQSTDSVMAGWNNYGYRNMIPSGVDEDFGEEDVWSYGYEREDSSFKQRKPMDHSSSTCGSGRKLSSAPRSIHKASNPIRSHEHKVNMAGGQQSSAPVKIPDWSKIYGKSSAVASRNGSWVDDGGCGMGYGDGDGDGDPYVDDDGHHGMVPPHEWLSRKHARSQASSFSMCEGVGRTLKGRDLSKLRNAILTKTGFLE